MIAGLMFMLTACGGPGVTAGGPDVLERRELRVPSGVAFVLSVPAPVSPEQVRHLVQSQRGGYSEVHVFAYATPRRPPTPPDAHWMWILGDAGPVLR